MKLDWIEDARRRLRAIGRSPGRWGYRDATTPAVEPSAIAGLALARSDPASSRAAGAWLASIQRDDGSLGVTGGRDEPGWATSHACLLWGALGGFDRERRRAADWLLRSRGGAEVNASRWPIGHDMSLVGWPWIAGTHSWVEPTSMAILALSAAGMAGHPRVVEGTAVLRDRAIETGGWNIGNPRVFGTSLRALPGQTGHALLAMSRAVADSECVIGPAIAFLGRAIGETLAPVSLAWGLLGLRAWGAEPEDASARLTDSHDTLRRRPTSVPALAMLLIAADEDALDSLGINPIVSRRRHES